jgi:hypothetical protein
LLLGGIVLTHGTELYSAALITLCVAVARWRQIPWSRLPLDLGLALVVGLVSAVPYLPPLLAFARGGGASGAGFEDVAALAASSQIGTVSDTLLGFGLDALGVDLPVRVVMLAGGIWWVFGQRRGRDVIAVGMLFCGLALAFGYLNGIELIGQLYARTYPWSTLYRLLTISSAAAVLVAATGGVALARAALQVSPRVQRAVRVAVPAWIVLGAWAMTFFVSIPVGLVSSYGPDDDVAMRWLRANAAPGSVVVNDGFADAGIWVPYKAGLPIVLPRTLEGDPLRLSVVSGVARLDEVPEACALNVRYVYVGAKNTSWQARSFPSLEELRASSALEEVFSSGQAVVFRVRNGCGR